MKVVDFLKKYFNSANKIVFWITVISIVWIIGYMFFWIDMNPIFICANKVADILYIISTSIVSSGIFYLFTIYITTQNHISIIKKNIIFGEIINLKHIHAVIFNNTNTYPNCKSTKDDYTKDTFNFTEVHNKMEQNDRINYFIQEYRNEKKIELYMKFMKAQLDILDFIINNTKTFISLDIIKGIHQLKFDFYNIIEVTINDDDNILQRMALEYYKKSLEFCSKLEKELF